MIRALALTACSLFALAPTLCHARATFRVTESGEGFRDNTPAPPVAGNAGTTVGEQRHLAVAYAFEQWAGLLDSTVPIDVHVEFTDLGGCDGGLVLGQAGPTSYISGQALGADPLLYPVALANSLAGEDLAPNQADIEVTLNTAPDDSCRSSTGGYYYGFDGNAGGAKDLVEIVLHEFAHGLGFASTVDKETGQLFDVIDSYSAQLFDLEADRPWTQLTAAERARSIASPRRLAWMGPQARRVAASVLTYDQPTVTFEPHIAEWSGIFSDTSFGQAAAMTGVAGPVVLEQNCNVTPPAAPGPWIALFTECDPIAAARTAAEAGASGAFLSSRLGVLPPFPEETTLVPTPFTLPLIVLSPTDARRVQATLAREPLVATIAADPSHRLGTDALGRPLMYASDPVARGSTVSHVDPSMRPNQLMEPTATPKAAHDLALARAMLQDIGWSSRCGNGTLDPTEECDDGEEGNNKLEPDGCRKDCRNAYCGDGVVDDGEDCDDGLNNSDSRSGACRMSCKRGRCGDGVVDEPEQCDEGTANDDSLRDGCRTSCRFAHCGDGVLDALEQCDDGEDNSDDRADACRRDCRSPRCGDGVVDDDEQCDGTGDCRSDCTQPQCGDGIVDEGEQCDGTRDCRNDCTEPKCGDGIVDEGEQCDGSDNCDESCQPTVSAATSVGSERDAAMPTDAAAIGQSTQAQEASPSESGGCGCRIALGPQRSSGVSWLLLGLGALVLRARRRRRLPDAA